MTSAPEIQMRMVLIEYLLLETNLFVVVVVFLFCLVYLFMLGLIRGGILL